MEAETPNRVVQAASGVKKFLVGRLSKLCSLLQKPNYSDASHSVYKVEDDPKHPDWWENTGDGCWIRHHVSARRDPYVPASSSDGPDLKNLLDNRLTERHFPDGKQDKLLDSWRTETPLEDEVNLWRGKTIFFVEGCTHTLAHPKYIGKLPDVDQNHTPTTELPKKTGLARGPVRKIVEICTFTMMMTALALASTSVNWQALTPISIEHGFDLLTPTGRQKAETYLRKEKPDLSVAEWMCDPFSSMQNINIAKGGLTAEKILENVGLILNSLSGSLSKNVGKETVKDTGLVNSRNVAVPGTCKRLKRCKEKTITLCLTCAMKKERDLRTLRLDGLSASVLR